MQGWRCVVIILAAVAAVGCGRPPAETREPPANLLLISLDALRADHLSAAGYFRHTSPFLDELAARGTRYSHASVNTHGTPSSHTTMLSSLYQETHRVWADPASGDRRAPSIPDEVELLQEVFHRAGYTTAAVTGGGWMSASYGFSRGFDIFSDQGRDADQGAALLVDSVQRAAEQGRPIFAFFHTYQVHSPYLPPARYRTLYGEFPSTVEPTSDALRPLVATAARELTAADFDFLVSQYDGEIRFLDDCLRRLFRQLGEIGFLDNAVVLITADHGEEFGDHGGLLHRGTLYDELVRVPFIIWGRGVPAGVVDPALVSTVDIAPTLLEAAGVEPPSAMEGRNVLTAGTTPWPEQRTFAQYRDALYSIRTPRFKLIRHRGGTLQLFDLVADPRERRNLAAARPALTARLASELEAWRQARPRLADETSSRTEIDPSTEEQLRALGYVD
ncbi:MAG: sulfatase [Holophagae bacterium]|jgi:arylsulfatase A-like enzyme